MVKNTVAWWYNEQQRQVEQRMEADVEMRDATMDELNVEWGGEYRGNINRIESLLSKFPEESRDLIKNARAPDGSFLMNHPDILRGFVNLSYEADPAGVLVPAGTTDVAKGVDDRISEIETMMRTNRKEYNSNEKVQQEYRDLINARERLQKRAS